MRYYLPRSMALAASSRRFSLIYIVQKLENDLEPRIIIRWIQFGVVDFSDRSYQG